MDTSTRYSDEPSFLKGTDMAIPKGATVRQVVPTIEGEVIDRRFNDDSDGLEYLVSYAVDGEQAQRWFLESQVEQVEAQS